MSEPQKIQPFSSAPDSILAVLINHVDDQVGRLVQKLDELGIIENTVIIFLSDNGGTNARNHPLRGHKGNLFEGGVGVPFIIDGPSVTQPGRICNSFLIAEDFYPTLIEMADLSLEPNQQWVLI